ncbi:MAG: hydantoinase/oxoprolinase family protein [Acidimicrobiia bacterium]|nr:hydantoinase/oxoprolinase family protein [Acidimicrobiia bacterium]
MKPSPSGTATTPPSASRSSPSRSSSARRTSGWLHQDDSAVIVGVDTGGTFTDVVDESGAVVKVLSNREDPALSVAGGLGGRRPDLLCHGTTVATNALLERRGATVALITNRGFADVIEIARQDRPSLYDQWADRPEPLVPRHLRLEVAGRLDAGGKEIEPLGPVPDIPREAEAVAVCLLHADLESDHEEAVAIELRGRGHDVTTSSDVSPEFREYERTVTTVVNAYLRPVCGPYLERMTDLAGDVLVMTSSGGLLPARDASELPVALLLSGPAGGVQAAAAAAAAAGFADAVSFDMGGTSTDVCLIRGATPAPAPGRTAAGFPIRLPSLDIQTIGAGGGSIARIDPGGALAVGPRSAGADPGPACYGRGGTEPTVTDADLVLGRIPSDATFGDLGRLDVDAARAALEGAGVSAEGVVDVVDAAMERAVRLVSVERGVDPSGIALVAFGGAGPLHACAVADALGMAAVVVPPRAGVLSAVGLLTSPRQRELVRSWPTPDDHAGIDEALDKLSAEVRASVGGGEVEVTTSLDCRYAGQSHELTVGGVDDFADEHRRRNGYVRPGAPIEVVVLRARARQAAPLSYDDLGPAAERRPAAGPTVLAEPDCTVWVPDGWTAEVGGGGAWVLRPSRF